MEPLIPTVNKLHQIFKKVKKENVIQLPQIVVVGSQSAGKSSVIEGIVGKDFLPRGEDLVTRAALRLQLIHIEPHGQDPHDSDGTNGPSVGVEYGIFGDGDKRVPIDDIRKEIEKETHRLTKGENCISNEEIDLKIYSPRVIDVTLVDLPGMVQMPITGQPSDIREQIIALVDKYIKERNTIILAIHPANMDIANSEALNKAREFDPNGERTMAVFTKIDMMDKGTNARKLLDSKEVKAKLGVICVVNRSQKDINDKMKLDAALRAEEKFLRKHYSSIAGCHGILFLSQKLSQVLMQNIQNTMPLLKTQIWELRKENTAVINACGDPIEEQNRGKTLVDIISSFVDKYRDALSASDTTVRIETAYRCGGALIADIFYKTFREKLRGVKPLQKISTQAISIAIKNAAGPRTSLLVPEITFVKLVKEPIEDLREPSKHCVRLVNDEMQQSVQYCLRLLHEETDRFPELMRTIGDEMSLLIMECEKRTLEQVDNLIQMELAHANIRHIKFIKATASATTAFSKTLAKEEEDDGSSDNGIDDEDDLIPSSLRRGMENSKIVIKETAQMIVNAAKPQPSQTSGLNSPRPQEPDMVRSYDGMTATEKAECIFMEHLIRSYFNIVRNNIQDLIPKAIMCFLVNAVRDEAIRVLTRSLYTTERLTALIKESKHIAQKRQEAAETQQACDEALKLLDEIVAND